MEATLKSRWLARLRDPASKQAHGRLQRDDAFCCLGYLAMVCKADHEINAKIEAAGVFIGNSATQIVIESNGGCDTLLPSEMLLAIGLDSDIQEQAWRKNDGYGKQAEINEAVRQHTLPEIADWLEKVL